MDPLHQLCGSEAKRMPRASGDGPFEGVDLSRQRGDAPRERGWTLEIPVSHRHSLGCPARAGMDPFWPSAERLASGMPRASGDGPAGKGHFSSA